MKPGGGAPGPPGMKGGGGMPAEKVSMSIYYLHMWELEHDVPGNPNGGGGNPCPGTPTGGPPCGGASMGLEPAWPSAA